MLSGSNTCSVSEMLTRNLCKLTLYSLLTTFLAYGSAYAEDQTPAQVRAEAAEMFGMAIPELEVYPDSAVVGAWTWMKDLEDGKGVLDAKTRELIGLAVASQIPCQYCIHYHRRAAAANGATEQEMREASTVAAITRHWSTILYGAEVDIDEYKAKMDKLFATQ